eukprot:gnl/MRDRNA2_/MRDRNA2_29875_c0_seq1.p1 gnl/MRDRNA2_/MRDRNA2_29875_c0~~gnl/MRDRNA2_/MRDRNA2_29875_c0_seq1.p1  ORF type:complete len:316 (+),score=86.01 gnl/MRDRNA2_/MRDRNA2_29875_c0_seq1:62-1009(+)
MAPEIDRDERTLFERQLLDLAKDNDLKQAAAPSQADANEQVESSSGNVEDMVQDLLGALKREKKKDLSQQGNNVGTQQNTNSLTSLGHVDDEFAQLLGALDDALDNSEEAHTGGSPNLDKGAAGYADTRNLHIVTASSGPGDAELAKLLGDLGDALNKSAEPKVPAQPMPAENPKKPIEPESAQAPRGPGDADMAKLAQALGNALNKPEERKVLADAELSKADTTLRDALIKPWPDPKARTQVHAKQRSDGSIEVESVSVSSSPGDADLARLALNTHGKQAAGSEAHSGKGPTDADLANLMGSLGKALKNSEKTT